MTLALGCIGAAWLLVFFPRIFVMAGQAKRAEGYDDAHPRDQQAGAGATGALFALPVVG